VEKDQVGGRCLNYACIPAKAVLRTADVLQEVRDADEFGLKVAEPEVDYAAVMARREKVIKTLTGGVSGLFKKNGVEFVEGEARDRAPPTWDPDISKVAERQLKRQGIKLHTKTFVEHVQPSDSGVRFSFGDEQAEVEWLVIAAGRGPDVDALGLADAGVEID